MNTDEFQNCLDLRREDLDPELFGAALVVQCIYKLIANGGSEFSGVDWDSALHPHHLQAFLKNAVEPAHQTRRFERQWQMFQRIFPQMASAWEKGQELFQIDLARAITDQEEMEYLTQIDLAVDCYAYASSMHAYPKMRAQQAWAINGYMVAWRKHFLDEDIRKE